MEQRRETINPISRPIAPNAHVASSMASSVEETPLRRYFAALNQSDEGQQLLRHIRLFVHKARITGEQSAHEIALEILQDIVVEALKAEERFDRSRSLKSWLLGIASNLVKRRQEDLFRQRKQETLAGDLATAAELTEEQIFDRLVAKACSSPEQEFLAAMELDELLAQLSLDERHIIELNVFHKMNATEVAQALGITPGNARVRFHRALKRLRTILVEREAGREEKQSDE